MFGHNKEGKATFGAKKPMDSKPGGQVHGQPMKDKQQGDSQMHKTDGSVQHVTKTHPGETQPHPATGVHAVHVNHMGGGKYKTHTHHEDGNVETQDHQDRQGVDQAMDQAMPHNADADHDDQNGDNSFEEQLGGIGSMDSSGE